jgi:hypothetical protein
MNEDEADESLLFFNIDLFWVYLNLFYKCDCKLNINITLFNQKSLFYY